MAFESLLPAIDNRTYDDIVAEARIRIPRYTPEWTDLNESDPGMALVELMAWLTEMQLYRLGQVPQLNYLKFIELLGLKLLPAVAATAEITFPVKAGISTASVDVPKGTQVSAESNDGGAPVVFETDRTLMAVSAPMVALQANDGNSFSDVTAANTDAIATFQPFGIAAADAALYLGFDIAAPFPPRELDLAVFAPPPTSKGAIACNGADAKLHASAKLFWEYWNGASWRSLAVMTDSTLALARSGHVVLRMPAVGSLQPLVVGLVATPLFYVRARLAAPTYERAPSVLNIRTNTVSATQAVSVTSEVVGGTTGVKDATYALGNAPVLANTLQLFVDEGDGPALWAEVEDFYASTKRDRHFMFDQNAGIVRFGDGINGAIPAINPSSRDSNIVASVYRYGGGVGGNVGAGKLKTLASSVDDIDAGAVTNLLAAYGGQDGESLEHAKLRAPRTLRNHDRAVTADDFEQLATQAPGVRRARAIPLRHPDFPGVQVAGAVTVIVVPDGDAPNPMPSAGTLLNVCQYLDSRRLITSEVYVMPPSYRRVTVSASVTAQDNADSAALKRDIEDALHTYFHPLLGGEDGKGWPFGEDIYFSRVFGKVSISGVRSIDSLVIAIDGIETAPCTNIPVCDDVLLYSHGHDITVSYRDG
jgi:predicted phage baseplate assembly protein